MRTHKQIIADSGGTKAFADAIGVPANRANQMRRGDSIPSPYWKAVVLAELATFSELAEAAEKRRPEIAPPESCAA